ncbi:MAG: cellulase family glycosylhydrolase [Chloroflexi bacterium]|nr:cellulase family glycosylhydrolase [Chloroflexota bacterium]
MQRWLTVERRRQAAHVIARIYGIYADLRRWWPWYLRGLIFMLALDMLVPAAPRAPLGPPQTVETIKPHVCVHTRLIEEVEEWKIQRSLELTRALGAETIVEFFPWAYIETAEDRYDWTQADRIVSHARNQGIRIIARMGLVPAWARPDPAEALTTLNTLPPASYADFAAFVAEFAARYAGVIDHLIIWNEPNLAFEWGYQSVDPAGYVDLLRAVYDQVKVANPDAIILAGALAPTLEPPGSPHGLNDLIYLERMYQAGAADYFDALAVHTYGFTEPAAAESHPDLLNFRRAEQLYAVMQRFDDGDTPVYITETGWNDHPRWTMAVSPSQRIGHTIAAFRWAEVNWPWLEQMCLWVLRFPLPTLSYPDSFTLITTDFQLKPIYHAVQAYARGFPQTETLWLPPPAAASP